MTTTLSLQQAAPDTENDAGPGTARDSSIEQQLLALQAENQKLRKINQALIERVEAGQNAVHTGPYAAFQHAAVLAEQVRERTAELSRAYDELRRSVRYSETLAQSERWIRTITDHVPAMIAYLSATGIYLFTNRGYDDFYGVPAGSLLNQTLDAAHGPEGAARLAPYVLQVLSGQQVVFEIDEQNAGGERRHLLKTYVPHRDEQQQISGFFVLNRDITERKRTSEALRQANLHLEQRVAERTAALTTLNQQLRAATTAAEQANQSKSQLLAAVSHDVLQPLNAARLFNGALLEQQLDHNQQQLVLSAGRALDDVGDLLRTLVDLSKLDAGQLQPDRSSVALGPLLAALASEFAALAASKGLRFRFVATSATVQTDPAWLTRILRNLLTNALRYTPPGGAVLLGCRRRGDKVEIQVLDSGVGIADEHLELIFQEFQRLPQSRATEAGLGLGLAIVERLCRLLAHPLRVQSELNRGSVFALQLPVAQPEPVLSQLMLPAIDKANASIWVIDNDATICQAMDTLLTSWGYQVQSGADAAAFAAKAKPDLLIVDYQLADGLLGTTVAQQLKSQAGFAELPVLMITANSQQQLAIALKQQGYQLLYKPVRPLQLKSMLRHLLLGV